MIWPVRPQRGTIRFDGQGMDGAASHHVVKSGITLVPEGRLVFPQMTVMENLRYGRLDATDAEVIEAAKMADADHFIRQLPRGYQTVLSERAGNLSQGQRQPRSRLR